MSALLRIRNLRVRYTTSGGPVDAVGGVDIDVPAGQTVAVVGESGSGKSTVAHAVMRLLPSNADVMDGSVHLDGVDVRGLRERSLRRYRGGMVGLVQQDPGNSLNPLERVGWQVAEVLRLHGVAQGRRARLLAVQLLAEAALPDPERVAASWPGELSGGMRQRVLIAMALAAGPSLVIADEPTSALDVTVQRQVLNTLASRVEDQGAALLLVTHDLGVAADRADHVVVMKDGLVVEHGKVAEVLGSPQHPYTRALVASVPGLGARERAPKPALVLKQEAAATPVLRTDGIVKDFGMRRRTRGPKTLRALDGVSLAVHAGRTLAIVGESGSGKTTFARIVARLEVPTKGTVHLDGRDITELHGEPLRQVRRDLQIVYQNPYASLEPRFSVEQIVTEPLRHFAIGGARERRERAADLLEQVTLSPDLLSRLPRELSGGQRQRVAIARSLALNPRLLILDEPVSALDVTVQAQVLELLARLQRERGIAYLFITHDLGVVRQVADEVAVMKRGEIVERGLTDELMHQPRHAYTQQLLEAVPGSGVSRSNNDRGAPA